MSLDKGAIDAAVAVYGDDAREFVRLTLKDADDFMNVIASALQERDKAAAGLAAHSLKSIMRQIGAAEMGAIAYEMEKAGKAEQWNICTETFPRLQSTYAETRAYLVTLSS